MFLTSAICSSIILKRRDGMKNEKKKVKMILSAPNLPPDKAKISRTEIKLRFSMTRPFERGKVFRIS